MGIGRISPIGLLRGEPRQRRSCLQAIVEKLDFLTPTCADAAPLPYKGHVTEQRGLQCHDIVPRHVAGTVYAPQEQWMGRVLHASDYLRSPKYRPMHFLNRWFETDSKL